jgi:hypothetical protein
MMYASVSQVAIQYEIVLRDVLSCHLLHNLPGTLEMWSRDINYYHATSCTSFLSKSYQTPIIDNG